MNKPDDYWEGRAILLRLLSPDNFSWLGGLTSFMKTADDSNRNSTVACRLVGVEPSYDNKMRLASAVTAILEEESKWTKKL